MCNRAALLFALWYGRSTVWAKREDIRVRGASTGRCGRKVALLLFQMKGRPSRRRALVLVLDIRECTARSSFSVYVLTVHLADGRRKSRDLRMSRS